MKQSTVLTSINGNELAFRSFDENILNENLGKISNSSFATKFQDFHVAQNIRPVWESAKELLQNVVQKRNYKKGFKDAIFMVKEELGFITSKNTNDKENTKELNTTLNKKSTPTLKYQNNKF